MISFCGTIGAIITGGVYGASSKTDDNAPSDSRRYLANDPTQSSEATLAIQLVLIVLCLPMLINLMGSLYRVIDNLYHNRAPRHFWKDLIGTLICGVAAGGLADIAYGYYTVTAWSIMAAYWFDFALNTFLSDNQKFDQPFTLTTQQFKVIYNNRDHYYTETDETKLLNIGKILDTCHTKYINDYKPKNPGMLMTCLHTVFKGVFYRAVNDDKLTELHTGHPTSLNRMTQYRANK
jgi:hypothetical protein